tara:strand:+ start:473 stop:1246 length:774 start_codon:yes stop_codon:yes gene_type:complete
MATYSEAFLDSLSRASSSVADLMQQVKEPSFGEKLELQTDANIKELEAKGDIESMLLGKRGDIDKAAMAQKFGYDKALSEMGLDSEYEIAAMRELNKLNMLKIQGDQALDQIGRKMEVTASEAGYDALTTLGAIDFAGVSNPEENRGEGLFGSAMGLLNPMTYWRFMVKDESRAAKSRQEFSAQLGLLQAGVGDVLRSHAVNPDGIPVQEALGQIDLALETAEKLYDNATFQNFGDDADYYYGRIESLLNLKNALEK